MTRRPRGRTSSTRVTPSIRSPRLRSGSRPLVSGVTPGPSPGVHAPGFVIPVIRGTPIVRPVVHPVVHPVFTPVPVFPLELELELVPELDFPEEPEELELPLLLPEEPELEAELEFPPLLPLPVPAARSANPLSDDRSASKAGSAVRM